MSGSSGGSRTLSLDPAAGGISVPRLYFALLRQRFTGTLTLTQREPAGSRTVWLRGGMPVLTDWVGDEARPGETARDLCARRLVETFVAEAVEPEATVTAVEHGKGKDDELGQVNVLALLLRGVEAHYDTTRIEAELGGALGGDLVATPALARYERQFGFTGEDAPILAALARGTTLTRLRAPGIEPGRARRIIYTLWAAQMLRVGEDAVQAIAKGATAAAAGLSIASPSSIKSAPGAGKPASSSSEPPPSKPPPSKPTPTKPTPTKPTPIQPPESAAEPEPEPEPEDDFVDQLAALEAKVEAEAHAFELFGLELDAERKQIRAAWAELSKRFHPDALEGAGRASLRERVERVFAALSEAYGLLSNKGAREKLREAVQSGGGSAGSGDDTAAVVRNAFEAELLARDADKALHARQWARAAELYTRAHALSPQDSDVEAALRYAEFRRGDAGEAQATLVKLDALLVDAPNCARAHYFKGLLLLGLDDSDAAKLSFAEAHRLDPRNIDAERQLRAIRLRERGPSSSAESKSKSKSEKKRGFGLRDLFKK